MATVLLEARPYRPFKSSEEYLYAMREDLAEWLNILYPELAINVDNFMDRLDTGVALCKHANNVRQAAEEYIVRRQARNKCMTRSMTSGLAGPILALGTVHYLSVAKSGTFFARDNVSNFITWCRKSLQIFECLLFETDDLIMRKNEKHVILCLLEVARRGAKFGMLAPMLVQMERQIDREIAADNKAMGISIGCGTENDNVNNTVASGTEGNDIFDSDTDDEEEDNGPMMIYGPKPQIITNDLKSLDEMVRDLVEKCTCPSQFPMIRVSEGKYRIGDTKVLIFVRILRSHVMVRVGGGWDTLSHYLDKHDPCRCKAQHRSAVAAKLITRNNNNINGGIELHKAQVVYDRSPPTSRKQHSQQNSPSNNNNSSLSNNLSPPQRNKSRSRSPTPQTRTLNHNDSVEKEKHSSYLHAGSPSMGRRSKSPSQRRLNEFKRKQYSLDSNASTVSNASLHQQNHAQPNLEKFENVENFKSDTINIEITGKSDNISDNGSEISDEGYRSLGIIHNKRASLHSEASNDDIDSNGRMENENGTSSDSPISELSLKATDLSSPDTLDYSTTTLEKQANELDTKGDNSDAESDKVVSIAMNTGLRKTGFSDIIYEIESPKTLNNSKIPRSPQPPSSPQMVRRKSIDNSSVSGDKPNSSLNRKIPAYRSVRRPNPTGSLSPELGVRHQQTNTNHNNNNNNNLNSTNNKKDGNSTWSGRGLKSRPTLNPSTYQSPQNGFNRNASTRSSMSNLTEKTNGRTRIKTTPTTSPIKTKSNLSSPLAKEILQVAGNSKNDVQILKNVQEILNKYNTKRKSLEPESKQLGGGGGGGGGGDYTDFTAQWVNNSGTVELANTTGCDVVTAPHKTQLVKQKSTLSSTDSTQSKDTSIAVSPRTTTRDRRGMSKIPAPVRIPC